MEEILEKICSLSNDTVLIISNNIYLKRWTARYKSENQDNYAEGMGTSPLRALQDLQNELEMKGIL